jgi:hypothetical protein
MALELLLFHTVLEKKVTEEKCASPDSMELSLKHVINQHKYHQYIKISELLSKTSLPTAKPPSQSDLRLSYSLQIHEDDVLPPFYSVLFPST